MGCTWKTSSDYHPTWHCTMWSMDWHGPCDVKYQREPLLRNIVLSGRIKCQHMVSLSDMSLVWDPEFKALVGERWWLRSNKPNSFCQGTQQPPWSLYSLSERFMPMTSWSCTTTLPEPLRLILNDVFKDQCYLRITLLLVLRPKPKWLS